MNVMMIKRFLSMSFAVVAVVTMYGCASPANRAAMAVQNSSNGKTHPYSVSVETAGGQATGAMDSSNISNEDLKAAIENSITQTNLFKSLVSGKTGDYELTVTVTRISKPVFGLSLTVDLETAWSLVKVSDNSVAMRKVITSTHTATFSDAAAAVTRLRLAVEGAAQSNISQGLDAIAMLNL
jgi:hypothetical protein